MASAVISDFLDSSTIHGLRHITTSKSLVGRVAWVSIVVACFTIAISMISNSYKEWQDSPVSTTISTHPIADLEFPLVTVCPPWGSNTALNHLLNKVKDVNFTKENRQELVDLAREVFIERPNRKNGKQMVRLHSLGNLRRISNGMPMPEVEVQKNVDNEHNNLHYKLQIPGNTKKSGNGDILVSVRSDGEWGYMLQDTKYRIYRNGESLNMTDAENICLAFHCHLASIGSQEEQEEIEILTADAEMVWLGGRRKEGGDGWQWLDGRAWTYQRWGYQQPSNISNEDCLYFWHGSWSSSECNLTFAPKTFVCRCVSSVKTGNHTFSLKRDPWPPTAVHIWKNQTVYREESEIQEFNLVDFWIEENATEDVREFVSHELAGDVTTPGFGSTPAPSDYNEKVHRFRAIIELPSNITQIISDGDDLVVDLKVIIPDNQPGKGVDLLTTGPKLEYQSRRQSWLSSEDSCLSKGGHLASVPSPYHHQRLQDFISTLGLEEDSIWLGGTDEEVEGDWKWSDGNEWSEERWKRHRGYFGTSKNCLLVNNGEWLDTKCSYSMPSICELPTTVRITKDTRLVFTSENISLPAIQFLWTSQPLEKNKEEIRYEEEWGEVGSKLKYEQMKRNWTMAEDNCVANGGHLASVSSSTDWKKVQAFVAMLGAEKDHIWLGGIKREGNWSWSDGSDWSEDHWNLGYYDHPDKNCLALGNGEWYDKQCRFGFSSICNLTKKESQAEVIGGYALKWQLSKTRKSMENVSLKKEVSWEVKEGQDMRVGANWNIMLVMSLVQKCKKSNLREEVVWGAIMKYRWSKEAILDSPCLNESQIFDVISSAGHQLGLKIGYTSWIRDSDIVFGFEIFSVLQNCPSDLVQSAQKFIFFEHLITHYSLETVIASSMNNIVPRVENPIDEFSSINVWYNKLESIYQLELGPVLASFATTKQLETMRTLKPPFFDDNNQLGGDHDCKGSSCISGKDITSPLTFAR